jgi:hypothetical protein
MSAINIHLTAEQYNAERDEYRNTTELFKNVITEQRASIQVLREQNHAEHNRVTMAKFVITLSREQVLRFADKYMPYARKGNLERLKHDIIDAHHLVGAIPDFEQEEAVREKTTGKKRARS